MIQSSQFGTRANGQIISAFRLTSEAGFEAVILNQGAILQSFKLPNGRNVALGFETWERYENDTNYTGRIIGPNANRIYGAQFQIDGDVINLPTNDGRHNLHSGPNGYDCKRWDAESSPNGLTLALLSPHGQNGFPGEVDAKLKFSLVKNRLRIDMRATSGRPTPMNLTWHPYWNLSESPRIDGHNLQIQADEYTHLESGAALAVHNTRYDFRQALPLGGVKLDTNYSAAKSACLASGDSTLTVTSSLPDMQIYTGDALETPRAGIAFEPQYRPNDMNLTQDSLLRPGELYSHWIEYRFDQI